MTYLSDLWKKPRDLPSWKSRLIELRKQQTIVRLERPTRIDKARRLGYKAKQGFVIVRVKVQKGTRKTPKPQGGRKPRSFGRYYPIDKSKQAIAEQKAATKFPNMEVLNSYWVAEDGQHKWFECILVDPSHPAIKHDKDISWIANQKHTGRAFRGLTSAGKKSRGLRRKGKGAEKVRQ